MFRMEKRRFMTDDEGEKGRFRMDKKKRVENLKNGEEKRKFKVHGGQ